MYLGTHTWICMLYIYPCMHTCVCTYAYMYTCTYVDMHGHMCACMYINTHITHAYVWMHVCVCIIVYECLHLGMYIVDIKDCWKESLYNYKLQSDPLVLQELQPNGNHEKEPPLMYGEVQQNLHRLKNGKITWLRWYSGRIAWRSVEWQFVRPCLTSAQKFGT